MPETSAAPVKEQPQFAAPKKKKKWLKRLIALVVIVALAALVLVRCVSGGQQAVNGSYLPAPVARRDMTVAVTGPGTVKPNDSYRATTLIKGEITSAPFEEGQIVHQDDVLFTIDATDVENAIKQARNGVEQANDNVVRSQAGIRQAQLAVDSAQLSYNTAVRNRDDNAKNRQLKANADGVITKLYVDPGDTIGVGTLVADILDRENMKLAVPFHSVDAAGFCIGQGATVTVSGTAETLSGSISEIAATDTVIAGGALVRVVTITVKNPGALSPSSQGSGRVGSASSSASAYFAYAANKQLISTYGGELTELNVKEGDRVSDGQVIGHFKDMNMQDQVDAAEIQLKNAQIARENASIALNDAIIAQRNAKNALEQAEDRLDDYTVTSPIEGTVIEKNYKAGDNYDPSTAASSGKTVMAVIYDMTRLTFDMNVDELDAGKVKVGQRVTITADALEGQEFTGKVDKVNINGTTVSGKTTYPVTVLVDGVGTALAEKGLWPGMNVSASIIIENASSVLCIPVDAVLRGNTVLVAGPGALNEQGQLVNAGKLEEREVTLGRNDEEYIEVLSGLAEGDTVFIQTNNNNLAAVMSAMGG